MIIIFNLLEWYKEKKKQKYENQIQEFINFNNYQISKYRFYPNKPKNTIQKYEDEWGICACYTTEALNKLHSKYNINQELINEMIKTEKECLIEYHKAKDRIKKEKQLSEEREKIRLYKKAILELKNENRI